MGCKRRDPRKWSGCPRPAFLRLAFNTLGTTALWREPDPPHPPTHTPSGATSMLVSPLGFGFLLLKALTPVGGCAGTILRDKTKPWAVARAQTKAARNPSAQLPTGAGLTGTGAHQQAWNAWPAQQRPQHGAPKEAAHGAGWWGTERSALRVEGGATLRPAPPPLHPKGPGGAPHPVPQEPAGSKL